MTATMDVRSGNILLESTDLTGVTPNYADIRNIEPGRWTLSDGRR